MSSAFSSPRFWMNIIFVCITCGLIDYFIVNFDFIFNYSLIKVLRRLVNERGKLNEDYKLPKCISDRLNKYKTYEQQKYHLEIEKFKIPQNTENLNIVEPEPLDSVYDENYVNININTIHKDNKKKENNDNNKNKNKKKFSNDEDSEIVPYFQEASIGLDNDFDKNFGDIEESF